MTALLASIEHAGDVGEQRGPHGQPVDPVTCWGDVVITRDPVEGDRIGQCPSAPHSDYEDAGLCRPHGLRIVGPR